MSRAKDRLRRLIYNHWDWFCEDVALGKVTRLTELDAKWTGGQFKREAQGEQAEYRADRRAEISWLLQGR